MERIVVGIDGSAGAQQALTLAAREARLRGAGLRIVCAWQVPAAIYAGEGFAGELDDTTLNSLRQHAEQVVRDAVADVKRTHQGLQCEGEIVEGQPADVLVQEAQDADLLVVGNRGHGGFTSLLLGSVSQQVVQHAPCPVLIVRQNRPPAHSETAT